MRNAIRYTLCSALCYDRAVTRIPGGRDQFPVRLNPGQRERLDALAVRTGRSAADVLRRALDVGLAELETEQHAADRSAKTSKRGKP